MRVDKKIKDLPWPTKYKSEKYDCKIIPELLTVKGEQLLVVTFVGNEESYRFRNTRNFRLICSKEQNTASILYEGARAGCRHSLSRAIGYHAYRAICLDVSISKKEKSIIATWLGVSKLGSDGGITQLNAWVDQAIEAEAEKERDARGELRDEDVNLCPDDLPRGLITYIENVVLPQDNVLIYKKGNVRGTCYICREKVRAFRERFRSGMGVNCPSCGARVIAHLETGTNFRADYVEDIVTIQKGTDGQTLFLRQWHLKRDPTAQWENIPDFLEEICRYAARGNRAAKWQHEAKISWYMNSYRERLDRWERVSSVSRVYDERYYFYLPDDWRQQMQGTSLQYCPLDEYANYHKKNTSYSRNTVRFLLDWVRYPAIEKFWKAGYKEAVSQRVRGLQKRTQHVVRWTKNSLQDAVQFPKRFLKIHAPEDWTMNDFAKVTDLWKMVGSGQLAEKDLPEMARSLATMDHIKDALGHASIHKILKYIGQCVEKEREQRRHEREEAQKRGEPYFNGGAFDSPDTYRDYLKDCLKLRLDLDDHTVLFPPDLEAAHARTIAAVKHKANAKSRKAFREEIDRLSWMQWKKGGLLIRLPTDGDELVAEGAYLHHCVGGYVDRMANGKTTILLIRRIEEPDKPFYTLEWLNGQVQQCRTTHNFDYKKDPEVLAFVDAWVKKIASKGKKKKSTKVA